MLHKHHLLPKYKGGTDDSTNLVEVTVTQHAMFHFCNWQLWGDKRDWLAWRGLTGEIGKEEILLQISVLAAQKSNALGATPARIAAAKRVQAKGAEAAKSEKSKKKRKETFKSIAHQQGSTNSQYGTMWVTNGDVNKKVKKTDPLPEGYYPGRKLK